ncbi:hypothetical protein V6N13_077343 [Hibiscus sabdariffa]|uniref:WRKY domain-containing protein n=1 Tax=Hibiscus sabdariffa TaxID=183260 RepID=A0ABR2CQB6_9ROSI
MEETGDCAQRSLVNELTQGRELAMQLQAYLNAPSSSCNETREWLVRQIQASYDNALSMLTTEPQPLSRTGSDPDRGFKEQDDQLRLELDASTRRKTLSRWTQQVRVRPGTSLDGPLDDGFCWRKYGQKDIHGAKYPRGYYRCAHRTSQGCLATKLVQRSDDDPTFFEITYRERHTCNLACNVVLPGAPAGTNIEPQQCNQQLEENQTQQSHDLLVNFQRNDFKVVTRDSDLSDHRTFPSSRFFSSPSVVGNISPMSSQVTESIQVAAASTSAPNAPAGGLNFPFGNDGFDPSFTSDNGGFLS